ncbi:MAG: endonuclease/exonuclease/phosphatase family protein [Proteobacteria bacterium]|nr:endonuclease/exonuclease/phosphatase family protein [Pseudomonadota bacterium]
MGLRFRIATFNLESLDARARTQAALETRVAVIRPQIERLRADVLCLQEVNAQALSKHGARSLHALDRLIEDTPYAEFHRAVSRNRAGTKLGDRHNLVILSRFPITSGRQYWHDLVVSPAYRPATAAPPANAPAAIEWDRPALHAILDIGRASPLHIFNLHLRAPRAAPIPGQKEGSDVWRTTTGWAEGFFVAAIKRSGQALEVRFAVDRVFDQEPTALIAVCGDFNAAEGTTPVRTLIADEEDTGNGRLAARALIALERSIAASERFSVVHHGRAQMLDHMLVSRALLGAYRHAEIHHESLGDELVGPARVARPAESYHAPVVAEFEFA